MIRKVVMKTTYDRCENIRWYAGGIKMSYKVIVDSCGELTPEMKQSGKVLPLR